MYLYNFIVIRYALVHPKEKRVVIVESLLCPTIIRNSLAAVLFDHFKVRQRKLTYSMLHFDNNDVSLGGFGHISTFSCGKFVHPGH